jgi:hypothetical protein
MYFFFLVLLFSLTLIDETINAYQGSFVSKNPYSLKNTLHSFFPAHIDRINNILTNALWYVFTNYLICVYIF